MLREVIATAGPAAESGGNNPEEHTWLDSNHTDNATCASALPKNSMTRHLTRCLATYGHTLTAAFKGKATKGKLFHVVIEGKYQPQYWLHLEMPATTRLKTLDDYLRQVWLECCGHLSAFKIEGQKRPAVRSLAALLAADPMGWRDPDEVDMEARLGDVLQKGSKLSYEYDFGSTTHLSLKVVGEREGWVVKPNDIHVLARNDPPHIPCGKCHKAAATIIDMENAYDESGWLCDACAEQAGLANGERTLPVVNSPRTGVCGYTGS
jgi:hypothetical protein